MYKAKSPEVSGRPKNGRRRSNSSFNSDSSERSNRPSGGGRPKRSGGSGRPEKFNGGGDGNSSGKSFGGGNRSRNSGRPGNSFGGGNRNGNAGRRGKGKRVSTLKPAQLVRKARPVQEVNYQSTAFFNDMPLDVRLKRNLEAMGFSQPTRIQEETLTDLVDGRNLLGIASTGTGKTGAFLIPIIQNLLNTDRPFRSLVMVPTRELALQVEQEFKKLSAGMHLFSVSLIGGSSLHKDMKKLSKFNHLIIATPGRLMDHMQRGSLHLRDVPVLVLDEFDRMLDMGFVNDIKKITATMKSRKQTMLFSATIDNKQKALIDGLLNNPVTIKASNGDSASDNVDQDVIYIPRDMDKFDMLLDLVDNHEFEKVLIFAETKRLVSKVSKRLNDSGMKSDQIHGNKSQNYRINALRKFKNGSVKLLVATDVAARGIDVEGVTHVINYEMPINYEDYIHRIGRTGRAGKAGKAFTFVEQKGN